MYHAPSPLVNGLDRSDIVRQFVRAATGRRRRNVRGACHHGRLDDLNPYAGLEHSHWCECPVESSPLATALTLEQLAVDAAGQLHVPDRTGLGMTPNPDTIRRYLKPVEIRVGGESVFGTEGF